MSHEDFNQELDALREILPTAVEETAGSKTAVVAYSSYLAEHITSLYAEGQSLHWISRQNEMPAYSTLLKWAKKHPEFSKMLRAVREARAIHFEDKAIEAAENAEGKDGDRLRFEAYKWGAEVNDPATYGKRVNQQVETSGKVVLQVVTGFGPPNKWQTSPTLNADGTINKTAIDVEAQVTDGPGNQEHDRKADAPADPGSTEAPRPSDAPSSGGDRSPDRLPAYEPEPGHSPGAPGPESP